MAGFVANATLQEIQRRLSIVDVVSAYVTLKRQGRNYVGLCPFHAEKTPSFSVSPEKGLFHCFGCGAGGSVFTFLMRVENIDFPTAVERLAQRAGVPLEVERSGARHGRERAYAVHAAAAEFFTACLRGSLGRVARAYLQRRGLGEEIAQQFGVGFCPPGSALPEALAKRGIRSEEAERFGLVGRTSRGTWSSRFAGRVIFPIRNQGGHVVAFAGRSLGDESPKYLNSPESGIFRKGESLFGVYEARQAIRAAGKVIVVEGYLDVLALVQAGIGYAVATMGTALSTAQLATLRRLAETILVCFDGDAAGEAAAERAFITAARAGVWAEAVFLPAGEDPDSFVRTRGIAAMQARIEKAIPLADFYFERKAPPPGASPAERARVAHELARVLATIEDPVLHQLLLRRAAERIGVDEHVLRATKPLVPVAPATTSLPAGEPELPGRPEEHTALLCMALSREVAERVRAKESWSLFVTPGLEELARTIAASWQDAQSAQEIVVRLPPPLEARASAHLLGKGPLVGVDLTRVARDCVAKLAQRRRREMLDSLVAELRAAQRAGDQERVASLTQRLQEWKRRDKV